MKRILQLLLFLTLAALVVANIPSCKKDNFPIPISEKHIVAPLLPDFTLVHKPVNWFVQLKNWLDRDHMIGKSILDACDISHIRTNAVALISPKNADRGLNLGQICDIFDYVQSWKYVYDPDGEEYFATPAESYRIMRGDCDDYAILVSTLQRSIGFTTEISVGYTTSGECHAFPEICLGPMDSNIIKNYIRQRYDLNKKVPVHIRYNNGCAYLSMERGLYPGSTQFEGSITMRLYLSDQYIEQFDR
jgi:hypothetical protein